ncbi:potassium transporter TrkA [archaeon SCG-AAA382B04]|nr:potassium transporter TrkA [archaeon SCG-AAA382B04]
MSEEEKIKKPNYVLIGCGGAGKLVAKQLLEEERKLVIIDMDPGRVDTLRDEGYQAYYGQVEDLEELDDLDLSETKTFIVLTPKADSNRSAIKKIKEKHPKSTIIVKAPDLMTKREFKRLGADIVIYPSQLIANTAIREMQNLQVIKKSRELYKELKNEDGRIGIFVHSNPDPDAISGAFGLKSMAESMDREADIVYSGEIGHQENRAFFNLLGIDLKKFETVGGVERYEQIALIDSAIPGQNNALPKDIEVDIIIDHHEVDLDQVNADFFDIRNDVGSTSTIVTKYIQELDVSIDEKLATAFLFGIRTDTLEFKRNVHTSDFTAASYLYPIADKELLRKIESPAMDPETLDILGEAIKNRKVFGSYLISNVGESGDKDALPQAADYLIQLEGVTTALVFGKIENKIHVSARNTDIRVNLGEAIRNAYGEIGSAGGHERMAGAQIPIENFGAISDSEVLMDLMERGIIKRFLFSVGIE